MVFKRIMGGSYRRRNIALILLSTLLIHSGVVNQGRTLESTITQNDQRFGQVLPGSELRNQVDPTQPYPDYPYENRFVPYYPNDRHPRGMPTWRNLGNVDPRSVVLPWQADAIFNDDNARYRISWHGSHYGGMPENAGDFNGDGIDDFINMSHFAYVDGMRKAGEVHIWFGKKNRLIDPLTEVPDVIIYGDEAEARLGISVAGIGDFDGDGWDDIAISAAFRSATNPDGSKIGSAGAVYVLYGRSIDVQERPTKVRIQEVGKTIPGVVLRGGRDGNLMLAWANGLEGGDVNGDGLADLIIGSYDPYMPSPFDKSFPPRAYVLYGRKDAKQASGEYYLGPEGGLTQAGFRYTLITAITTDEPNELLGSLGLGTYIVDDINGDGIKEIAIARGDAAYIYFGGEQIPDELSLSDANLAIRSGVGISEETKGIEFGALQSVRPAGDVNCDGHADLIITARSTHVRSIGRVGAVGILYGGQPRQGEIAFGDLNTVILGEIPGGSVGHPAMDRSGDLDGDGCSDVLVNDAYYYETIGGTQQERGRLWVIKGRPVMPRVMHVERDAALTFVADTTIPGMFGYTWNVGDWNGDGRLDIVIGDHYAGDDDAVWHAGKTYMYFNGYSFSLRKYLR